ncbi:MAG TPA: DUF1192 domain-containing protein [Caulobacteraceae bacterium]|jgi:uncharacterized small protein (DUF1192 family)|nr:DUF1192 domain-containing protein [Caulobacteraceae bacterium]
MLEEPPPPRRHRGEALTEAMREDLDLFAIEDLNERIEILETELARVRAQIERKHAGRAAADALFKR